MALLKNAADLWDIEDSETRDVVVPEWKMHGESVTIRLRGLTAQERDRYEASLQKMKNGQLVPDNANARARLVSWCAIDEGGSRLFKGDETMHRLGTKSSKALSRLFDAACELSGITEQDVEELTENFSNGRSEPSVSD